MVAMSCGTKSTKGGSRSLKGNSDFSCNLGAAVVDVGVARRKLCAGVGVRFSTRLKEAAAAGR